MINVTFVHNKCDLILEAVNVFLRLGVFLAHAPERGELLLQLMQILPGIAAVIVAFQVFEHMLFLHFLLDVLPYYGGFTRNYSEWVSEEIGYVPLRTTL